MFEGFSYSLSPKSDLRELGKITQYPGPMDRMLPQDVMGVDGYTARCT